MKCKHEVEKIYLLETLARYYISVDNSNDCASWFAFILTMKIIINDF